MTHVQNIIIGGGPAGLQMAYFMGRKESPYVVLEGSDHAGAFFDRHPRHRRLLSINKRHTGYPDQESQRRYDWNSLIGADDAPRFIDYTSEYFPDAKYLPRYLNDYAEFHGLNVRYGARVASITRPESRFVITLEGGERMSCDRLFVGTGFGQENLPSVEGLDHCETYDTMELDADAYTDKRIMIVGKGNSAFETAEHLTGTSRKIWVCGPHTVRLAWATHFVGDLRAVNNSFLDTYQLKAQNNVLDGALKRVWRDESSGDLVAEVYFASRKRSYEYPCDHVILCTGFRFDAQMFSAECRPEMRHCGRLPLMTCEWESVNVPRMFFIGTLMQSRDYRKTMSGFIHGFRHNIEALDQMIGCRDGAPWRARKQLPRNVSELARRLIERLSTSAGLLLQPGFLGDAIIVGPDRSTVEYLEGVPVDYLKEQVMPRHSRLYVATLEYQKQDEVVDPFAMPRGVNVVEDYYIHPIVRRYEAGDVTGKIFLPDDLDNDWRNDPDHLLQVEARLEDELGGSRGNPRGHSFVAELGAAPPPPSEREMSETS